MAVKKFVSLENLTEYDGLIKGEIKTGDDATLESANSYTDSKVSNITSGTIVVKEAEHADSSDEATHAGSADHAESADSATKATQDGDGKVITSTYETKTDASAKLTEAKTYTDSSVDELAANVAYIDDEDNENVVDDSPAANIVVDSALSTTSTNPVQNKVITNKINELQDAKVVVQNTQPTNGALWIDTDSEDEVILAEIDDYSVSEESTWSSKKISNEIADQSNQTDRQWQAIDNLQPKGDYTLKSELTAETSTREKAIADLKAQIIQQTPLFANTIEECTDTSKVYVLPDGYIYAYKSEKGLLCTNHITNAVGTDGKPFNNGLGYKVGGLDARGAETSVNPSAIVTGYIPIKNITSIVIRVSGFTGSITDFDNMKFYNASFENVGIDNNDRLDVNTTKYGGTFVPEPAFNGEVNTFTFNYQVFKSKTSWYSDSVLAKGNPAYVRFALNSPDLTKMVVAINEEISLGTTSKWVNTGRMFVPSDYEDRIIEMEEITDNHESRIRTLETHGSSSALSGDDIPSYIKEEADGVINRLMEKQGNRNFTMIAMSDFHYSNYAGMYGGEEDEGRRNLVRASKGVSHILKHVNIDAVSTLGDIVPFGEGGDNNISKAHRWFREINEILTMTQQSGVIDFRTAGNHDRLGGNDANGNPTSFMPDNAIYSYIGGYNRQCDYVNAPIGYGYKDFEGIKLRIIVLNTSECEGKGRFSTHSGYHIGNNQYNWLIKTLDLSNKEDATEWQILILSHHRADDHQVQTDNSTDSKNSYILPNILNAYKTGGSYSATITTENISVSCNFANKNKARLIGQIHGHHHNYKYQNLYLGATTNSNQTNIMAVGTPTTSFITNGNVDNNGNTYTSVKDTAEETAFCVYSIDLDNHKIHAIHYGNGIDREIDY